MSRKFADTIIVVIIVIIIIIIINGKNESLCNYLQQNLSGFHDNNDIDITKSFIGLFYNCSGV